jgi:hypothetical protein
MTVSSSEYAGEQQQRSLSGSAPVFQSFWRVPGGITTVSPAATTLSSATRRRRPLPLVKK